jgi:hypothetical protein
MPPKARPYSITFAYLINDHYLEYTVDLNAIDRVAAVKQAFKLTPAGIRRTFTNIVIETPKASWPQ